MQYNAWTSHFVWIFVDGNTIFSFLFCWLYRFCCFRLWLTILSALIWWRSIVLNHAHCEFSLCWANCCAVCIISYLAFRSVFLLIIVEGLMNFSVLFWEDRLVENSCQKYLSGRIALQIWKIECWDHCNGSKGVKFEPIFDSWLPHWLIYMSWPFWIPQ